MNSFIKFANYQALYFLVPILVLFCIYRLRYYQYAAYRYTLADFLKKEIREVSYPKNILFLMRFITLCILLALIAKPQFVDVNSTVNVEGIDIILDIDVSGSMQAFDDVQDRRSRIDFAKDEAIRFIKKRTNDQIGVVIFAKNAVSRCPLTLDKNILISLVKDLELGEIDPSETVIATSLISAANRLKNSNAKSKVIILLTDGEATPSDVPINVALDIAKKYGIKIYTIGIGNENGGFINHPIFGVVAAGSKLNKEYLDNIANQTGGQSFYAKNPAELKKIYDVIDNLEKSKYDTTIYNKYYDFFVPLIFVAILLLLLELLLTTFVWFSL